MNTLPTSRSKAVILLAAVALLVAMVAGAKDANAAECKSSSVPAYELKGKQVAKAIICLANKDRAERGMKRLKPQKQATKAAKMQTREMLKKRCFSHQCGKHDLGDRFSRAGYTSCNCSWKAGENIAYGTGKSASPRAIHEAWMDSPGHRANILNPSFRHIGVGFKRGTPFGDGRESATFTTTFGARG